MDVTTHIAAAGFRHHTVSGRMDLESIRRVLGAIYTDPDFRADQSSLWDLREADVAEFTTADVQALAQFVGRNWGTEGAPRSALVVAKDFQFAMTRMFEQWLNPEASSTVRAFWSLEEAVDWLTPRE